MQDLLEYYQKFERPVANEAEAVQLKFGLTLQQIMDVVSVYGEGFKIKKKKYRIYIKGPYPPTNHLMNHFCCGSPKALISFGFFENLF